MPCNYLSVLALCFCTISQNKAQTSLNVDLFGKVNRGDLRYSGCWSYVDGNGNEYALVGAKTGTAVYNIDDATNLGELGFVPGPETNWREITTLGDYAYVVTDVQGTGHSLQIIDLSYLPDSIHLLATYSATFMKGHIVQKAIDSDEPYIYIIGTSTTQGVHILDVSDPANPLEIGIYAPGYYIHDAHIRGNVMYAAAIYESFMDIVDIADKTNPVLIGKITYDGKNTHSSSSTEDGKYLITTDEADGFPARVFNVEDAENPEEITTYTANNLSLVHNPYVRGKYCFVSHNTEGLRVLDIADPELPVEVGFYDTYAGPSGGFNGLWSACPYFPSGKIIGGDRTEGLFIWTFNNKLAARIYGTVIDSLTQEPLSGATIEIIELADTLASNQMGKFKKGMLEGSYSLVVSLPGYFTKTMAFDLQQGDSLTIEIPLVPEDFSIHPDKHNYSKKLNVFPNPSFGYFNVDWTGIQHVEQIMVVDAAGRLISTCEVAGSTSFQNHQFDVPNGQYWIKALDDRGNILATASISVD